MAMKRIAIYHSETSLWIARSGTFRAAAERLNTTQPAISARVRESEDQLGIAIFQREGRRMVSTARGRESVRDCEPSWAGFERALLKASDFSGASGVVRIGAGEIAAASCSPGFVQQIERDLPGVTSEIEIDSTARMSQQVSAGTTDIAFSAGPVENPGIRTCGIGSVGSVWSASPGTVAQGGFARPSPVWSVPAHSPLHAVTMATSAEQRVQTSSINTCNNVRMSMEIVAGGDGAAVSPETMVRAEMAAGTSVEVSPRPRRTIRFEAAIRATEQDPVISELYRRAGASR
ncbi:hypothetical protein OY671_007593, partial [Metschnikowia pulcherrima]